MNLKQAIERIESGLESNHFNIHWFYNEALFIVLKAAKMLEKQHGPNFITSQDLTDEEQCNKP